MTPSPSPTPAPLSIAEARALPDGAAATIEGVALAGSDFSDGGGYLADASGGIAVLVADGSFARGAQLRVSGTIDDRYHQRTLRVAGGDVTVLGPGVEPAAQAVATGLIDESTECELVVVSGTIQGTPTVLSGGLAFDVDDGSGSVRVLVGAATGIDTNAWSDGTLLTVRGVVGQRDSSGSGTSGYRVQPRDPGDVLTVTTPPEPSPTPTTMPTTTPSAEPSQSGSPSPSPGGDYVSISQARAADVGAAVTVRGVVTMPPGIVDPDSAFLQDGSGAILLRLGDDAGPLQLGDQVEVHGTRSTKSGMATLRIVDPALHLGQQPQPAVHRASTGALGEPQEAMLVAIRGAVASTPQRSSSQNVYFDLDDGSGPMRIYLSSRAGIGSQGITRGVWLEVVGVLAQETTGRQPERGYRVWPRRAADVTVLASPVAGSVTSGGASTSGVRGGATSPSTAGATSPRLPVDLAPPRLAMAQPTHAASGRTTTAKTARPLPHGEAAWSLLAAGVLLTGALLLAATGWLAARPGLVARIGAWLAARPGAAAGAEAADQPPQGPVSEPHGVRAETATLVPLAVAERPRRVAKSGTSVIDLGARRDGGRILPPT